MVMDSAISNINVSYSSTEVSLYFRSAYFSRRELEENNVTFVREVNKWVQFYKKASTLTALEIDQLNLPSFSYPKNPHSISLVVSAS